MTTKVKNSFRNVKLAGLSKELGEILEGIFAGDRLFPDGSGKKLPALPQEGVGLAKLPDLWRLVEERSTLLTSPNMMAHMDVAPHPAAALTSALVAALSNNLLFRELSPFASDVEEQLIDYFIRGFGLGAKAGGTFVSGGSMANLSCLFAAVGGFETQHPRSDFHIFCPASVHLSVTKSAAVLGIPVAQVHKVTCDNGGRMLAEDLEKRLKQLPKAAKPVVVAVAGTTIHGSVDPLIDIAQICKSRGAWFHVDAIYGAALVFSGTHNKLLRGAEFADSIAIGPQKWMYVPRLSAGVLFKDKSTFEKRLGTALPYSFTQLPHRGQWGLQSSRPADVLVLWAVLHTIGTKVLGETVDHGIAMASRFHELLSESKMVEATHAPDLNIQTFRLKGSDSAGQRASATHSQFTSQNKAWFSLSKWNDEILFRAVILAPDTTEDHLKFALKILEKAIT